jgi:hypothetical protein
MGCVQDCQTLGLFSADTKCRSIKLRCHLTVLLKRNPVAGQVHEGVGKEG